MIPTPEEVTSLSAHFERVFTTLHVSSTDLSSWWRSISDTSTAAKHPSDTALYRYRVKAAPNWFNSSIFREMNAHPSHAALSPLVSKYPRAAGALFQTYNDLKLAQQWSDLEVIELTTCSRGALQGRRPKTEPLLYVVPCSLSESISISWVQNAFEELGSPSEIYVAINANDSSVVYYKLSPGIVKPPV